MLRGWPSGRLGMAPTMQVISSLRASSMPSPMPSTCCRPPLSHMRGGLPRGTWQRPRFQAFIGDD